MNKILELENVSVSYNGTLALDNISFEIKEGEIFGFLGPSGAGKTTTIKALTKQLKLKNGEIVLFDKPISLLTSSVYDDLGIMTDSNDVYESLSVEENIKFFASIRNVSNKEVEFVLKKVGLYEERKKVVKKLSKGMRQRVILASALVHKPKLLFLDEPTAALDPKTTHDIHEFLKDLNNEGTTIFLTTHSMEEAEKLCDSIAFIDQGRIVENGTRDSLIMKYAKNEIIVEYSDGNKDTFSKDAIGLMELAEISKTRDIIKVHSNEPSLETVFLTVTGRSNYENA